jgi:hypothetical protein
MWPVILLLVFAVALVASPNQGDGWFWEVGNGIGFLALALLLILIGNGRARLGHSARHRCLGIATLSAVIAHCLWFLIGDPVVWEYLQWGAPHYMVAGLLSVGLLLLITLSSLLSIRNQSYTSHRSFRIWHHGLSIAIGITALIHVFLSGFYLIHYWQILVLLAVALLVYILPNRFNITMSFARRNLVLAGLIGIAVFSLIRSAGSL